MWTLIIWFSPRTMEAPAYCATQANKCGGGRDRKGRRNTASETGPRPEVPKLKGNVCWRRRRREEWFRLREKLKKVKLDELMREREVKVRHVKGGDRHVASDPGLRAQGSYLFNSRYLYNYRFFLNYLYSLDYRYFHNYRYFLSYRYLTNYRYLLIYLYFLIIDFP